MKFLIQQLENTKYATIVYVLNHNSKLGDDNQINDVEGQQLGDISGYCDVIASQFSMLYNKTIIFWPCSNMKVSKIYLVFLHIIKFVFPEEIFFFI